MKVWPHVKAHVTLGGQSFDSRTPCRKASFQRRTTFPPLVGEDRRRCGLSRTSPPPPTVRRKWRREILSGKLFLPLVPGDPTAVPRGNPSNSVERRLHRLRYSSRVRFGS